MKANNYYFLCLVVILSIAVSCKKDNIAFESDFEKSQKSWIGFKELSNDSYRYEVVSSSWTGSASSTIITVKNGKVAQRSYIAKQIDGSTGKVTIVQEWKEEEDALNTHENGYSCITLDQVYEKAKTDWLLKRKDAKNAFEAKNGGLISSCGYIDNNCADDCFVGITISFIEST